MKTLFVDHDEANLIRELIFKLQSTEAYQDPGHFDHSGMMAAVEILEEELT